MPICRLCLIKDHRKHDVINIEKQEKEVLIRNLMRTMNLATGVEMMSQAKKNIEERTQSVIEEIKEKKQEFDSHFEKLIKDVEEKNKLQNMLIGVEISAMSSNIELLRSLRQNIQNEDEISHEEFMSNQETVREIIENINANLSSGDRSIEYPVINMGCEA